MGDVFFYSPSAGQPLPPWVSYHRVQVWKHMMKPSKELRAGLLHRLLGKPGIAIWDVIRKNCGNTTVEYALFLTLVAACGIAGAELLGLAVETGIEHLAFEEDQIAVGEGSKTPVGAEQTPSTMAEDESLRRSPAWYHLALGTLGIVCGWTLWYLIRRRRKTDPHDPHNDEPLEEIEIEAIAKRAFEKRQEILKILSGDWTGAARGDIEVGKLMSRDLCTVKPNASRLEIKALFENQSLRHVIVVDREAAVLGIISDRDLVTRNGNKASQIMTRKPFTVAPHTPITPAITMLVNRGISCLPVVANEKLCGVLTTTDLIMALQCILQILVRQSIGGSGELYDEEFPEADLFSEHLGETDIKPSDS